MSGPPTGDPSLYAAMIDTRNEFERVGRLSMEAYRVGVMTGYRAGQEREAYAAVMGEYQIAGDAHFAARDAWLATLPPQELDTSESRRASARGQMSLFAARTRTRSGGPS